MLFRMKSRKFYNKMSIIKTMVRKNNQVKWPPLWDSNTWLSILKSDTITITPVIQIED